MTFPWPETLDGAARRIGPFTPCGECGDGTWVRYGDVPRCLACSTGVRLPVAELLEPVSFAFTEEERERLARLASARGGRKRAAGIRDRKIDAERDDFTIDYLAIRGHYAMARATGQPFDDTVTLRGGPGYCLATRPMIQVRSTVHRQGHLLFNTAAEVVGELIVLFCPRVLDDGVLAVGWIGRDEFLALASGRTFGYGDRLALPQERLHAMARFPVALAP